MIVDTYDPRSIIAFLPNGAELGVLTAQGVWGRTPHTLEQRKAILSLKKRKLIHYTESDDPMQVYTDHLGREALKNKSARNKLADIRRTQKTKNTIGNKVNTQTREVVSKKEKVSGLKNNSDESKTQKSLPKLKTFTY